MKPRSSSTWHEEEPEEHRTLADLVRDLRDEMTMLVRQEIALAKAELAEKARMAGRNAAVMAFGGAMAAGGALVALAGAAVFAGWLLTLAGLSSWVAAWLGALLTGAIAGVIGYGMLKKGMKAFSNGSLMPKRTARTLKEDKEWTREKMTT